MADIDLSIFFAAAHNGDIFILKKCLDSGIDIHSCNDLALRIVTKANHTNAILFLLSRGANIQAVYDEELIHAALQGKTKIARVLLEEYSCSQEAKIYAMYNAIFGRHEEIIQLLLQYGVSPTSNNGAILNVVKLCNNDTINKIFKD